MSNSASIHALNSESCCFIKETSLFAVMMIGIDKSSHSRYASAGMKPGSERPPTLKDHGRGLVKRLNQAQKTVW